MNIEELIGDQPVSVQINNALQNHDHKDYVSKSEFEDLKKIVEKLYELIGDTPVSEQINKALQDWR